MRLPNWVLAAKCSDRWMGLRSPVSCAKPTTSDDAMVFDSVSVMPTDKSSKYRIRSTSWFIYLASLSELLLPRKTRWEAYGKQALLGAGLGSKVTARPPTG